MSSDSTDRNLLRGDRLREYREKRGLSQRDLARKCGLGINQINRYENGMSDAWSSILRVIAQELDVSADYLLGLSDMPRNYAAETLRPEERQLLDAFNAGDMAAVVVLLAERVRALGGEGEQG